MKESVWKVLGSRKDPYALAFDRQPSGRPDRKSAKGPGAAPERRDVLDSVTSGIGDVVTTWLPDHDVRLGEAWDLLSVADVHNLAPFLQRVAGSDVNPSGFPACVVKGMGAAEAVESREGEPCLRVRIVAYVTQEGDGQGARHPGLDLRRGPGGRPRVDLDRHRHRVGLRDRRRHEVVVLHQGQGGGALRAAGAAREDRARGQDAGVGSRPSRGATPRMPDVGGVSGAPAPRR